MTDVYLALGAIALGLTFIAAAVFVKKVLGL